MADAQDSKSCIRKGVWVRLPPPAPRLTQRAGLWKNAGATPVQPRRAKKGAAEAAPPSLPSGYHHPMQWWQETAHTPVVMHDWEQQKQLEEAIRDLVRLAVERAELEGYQQGYEDGK